MIAMKRKWKKSWEELSCGGRRNHTQKKEREEKVL